MSEPHVVSLRRASPPATYVEVGFHRKPEYKGHAAYYYTYRGGLRAFLAAVAFAELRLRGART